MMENHMKKIRGLIVLVLLLSLGGMSHAETTKEEILSFGKFIIGQYTIKSLHEEHEFVAVSIIDEDSFALKEKNYELIDPRISGHSEYFVANYSHYGITFNHVNLRFYHGVLYEITINSNIPSLITVLRDMYPKGFTEAHEVRKEKLSDNLTDISVSVYDCFWEQSGNIHADCEIKYVDDGKPFIYEQMFSIFDENISNLVLQETFKYWDRIKQKNIDIYYATCENEKAIASDRCQSIRALIDNL
jgi:hypothetical protein